MNKKYKIILMPKIDNSGQVLLIVTVLLTILIGVGLSISNQTLSSIFRTSQTDSFQKVTAAAEGGLEKYLLLSDNELKAKITDQNISLTFPTANTKAVINIAPINADNADSSIVFDEVEVGQVATFYFADNLNAFDSYNAATCIKISMDSSNTQDYLLNAIVLNNNPIQPFTPTNALETYDATNSNRYKMQKYLIKGGTYADSIKPTPCDGSGISLQGAAMLRIHPLKSALKNLKIQVSSSNLGYDLKKVTQGYKIISTGSFISGDDKTTRKITAKKFLDSPANVFDFTGFLD